MSLRPSSAHRPAYPPYPIQNQAFGSAVKETLYSLGKRIVKLIKENPYAFIAYLLAVITTIVCCASPYVISDVKLGVGISVGGLHFVALVVATDDAVFKGSSVPDRHPLPVGRFPPYHNRRQTEDLTAEEIAWMAGDTPQPEPRAAKGTNLFDAIKAKFSSPPSSVAPSPIPSITSSRLDDEYLPCSVMDFLSAISCGTWKVGKGNNYDLCAKDPAKMKSSVMHIVDHGINYLFFRVRHKGSGQEFLYILQEEGMYWIVKDSTHEPIRKNPIDVAKHPIGALLQGAMYKSVYSTHELA